MLSKPRRVSDPVQRVKRNNLRGLCWAVKSKNNISERQPRRLYSTDPEKGRARDGSEETQVRCGQWDRQAAGKCWEEGD